MVVSVIIGICYGIAGIYNRNKNNPLFRAVFYRDFNLAHF